MNFADIRNQLYDQAEKYWCANLLLGLGVQAVSAFSTRIQDSSFTIVASTILFFVSIIARWLQEKSKYDTSRALKCRLAILYSDAFGEKIPDDISREIKSWVGEDKLSKAPFRRPYYDSKLPSGANRLADIVAESAFWTYKLAESMRLIMSLYTGIYFISALTLIYFLIQMNLGTDILINTARAVIVMISLVFTSEATILINQYNELYTEAKLIYNLTAKMVSEKKLQITEIMQVVESYNIILISSPPIPGRLYRLKQNSLNKAYKKVISNE